jgi:hypothetical protein
MGGEWVDNFNMAFSTQMMDATCWVQCRKKCFGISGVEHWASTTAMLVSKYQNCWTLKTDYRFQRGTHSSKRRHDLLPYSCTEQCSSIRVQHVNAHRTTVFILWSSGLTPCGLINCVIISEDHTACIFRAEVRNVGTCHRLHSVATYKNTTSVFIGVKSQI